MKPVLQMLRTSVRGRLVALVLAIALPASLLVALLAVQGYRNERDAVSQHLLATARAISAVVDRDFHDFRTLLVGVASAQSLTTSDLRRFEDRARSIDLGSDRWIVLADADGQQLVNTRMPRGAPLPQNTLIPEHVAAMQQGQIYISNVAVGAAVKRPILFVSVPIIQEGRHKYTLSYVLLASAFANGITVERFSPGVAIAIVDRMGTVAARFPNGDRYTGQKASPQVVDAVQHAFEGIADDVITLEGNRVLTAISRAPESGWSVIMGAPNAAVYGPARRLLWWGLAVSLLLLGIAAIMAVWIGRAVVRGVDGLVADTALIGAGQFPTGKSSGLSEMDYVAEAMRATAQQLRERHRENMALFDLVARINRAVALPEIYDTALNKLLECRCAERAALFVADRAGRLSVKATQGFSATICTAIERQGPTTAPQGTPAPVYLRDIANSALTGELRDALAREAISAVAFVPLIGSGGLLGYLVLGSHASTAFASTGLIETFASQVVFAMERQQSSDALEALVEERTASLRQAIAQMEEFSYSVSHDLRAPARALLGYAEVILEDHAAQLDPMGRELLLRIQRSSRRMDQLIRDMLTYSRISRREMPLERVALQKTIAEIIVHYPELQPNRADIQIAASLPDVIGHEPSLTQAIANLLGNAVKFVAAGIRPHVQIDWEQRGSHARIFLRDNGVGIQPEVQSRLFQMFERGHAAGHYEGTGIGLAIVKKAIERMGGSVGLASDGISGSTFWFELPIAAPGGPLSDDIVPGELVRVTA